MATVINRGRQIEFINGINGVNAGAQAVVNLDVNKRFHRNVLQSTAVNYTGGTNLSATALTGNGTGLTVDVTVVSGVPTAVAPHSGSAGTGFTTGDTITFTDATGTGFVGTVTASSGAVTAIAITVAGTPSAVNPVNFYGSVKQLVNGIIMRDISPDNILRICTANGYNSRRGELPLLYTEPWFNVNQLNEITSWDMFGQSTFSLQLGILANTTSPGLNGSQEFDTQRNARPTAQGMVPFLQPIAQHAFGFNVIAGLNKINTIPFDFPIRRLWLLGSNPGNISQFEVYQDGNKVFEATFEQMLEQYCPYGFQFGQPNYLNSNWSTNNTLQSTFNKPNYFDFAYISDPDERLVKILTCANSLVLRVTSEVQQSLTVVVESVPGNYAS